MRVRAGQQANKGLGFERLIEISNEQYRAEGLAVVDKIPTPWIPIRDQETGLISGAKVQKKSTVDFVGCVAPRGRMIAFDAKENSNPTSFAFNYAWSHEVAFLRLVQKAGGIAFLLVHQVKESLGPGKRGIVFLVPATLLFRWWDRAFKTGGRKSIPRSVLDLCPTVPYSTAVPIDYLRVALAHAA